MASSIKANVAEHDEIDPLGKALQAKFAPHGQPLAQADYVLRRALFDCFCAHELWEDAAAALEGCISIPGAERARSFAEIAQCYLEEDDDARADGALRHVAELIGGEEEDAVDDETVLRYRSARARVFDLRRNYTQAAAMYSALSTLEGSVSAAELEVFLDRAATCAILDRPGPQRQRILTKVLRDPRSAALPSYVMLDKVCRSRIVSPSEAAAFRDSLDAHHLADTGGGVTVFDRSLSEHNILAASHIYSTISLSSLGVLLGSDASTAERAAAVMIEDGRLDATIDQLAGVLEFGSGAKDELSAFDASLRGLFAAVTVASTTIGEAHPEFVEE